MTLQIPALPLPECYFRQVTPHLYVYFLICKMRKLYQ
jgi:hypothetical protein